MGLLVHNEPGLGHFCEFVGIGIFEEQAIEADQGGALSIFLQQSGHSWAKRDGAETVGVIDGLPADDPVQKNNEFTADLVGTLIGGRVCRKIRPLRREQGLIQEAGNGIGLGLHLVGQGANVTDVVGGKSGGRPFEVSLAGSGGCNERLCRAAGG